MWRAILGIAAGLVAWVVIVSVLDHGLRLALPGYTSAEPLFAFTLPMKLARLAMAAVTSLAAGALVRAVAPASRWAPWIVGLVLLALFLPEHISIGLRLPIWYHLFFLVTLPLFIALGARMLSQVYAGRGAGGAGRLESEPLDGRDVRAG